MDKLYIIIPAYNEEANIELVAREWHEVVAGIGQDSRLVIINGQRIRHMKNYVRYRQNFHSYFLLQKRMVDMVLLYYMVISMR